MPFILPELPYAYDALAPHIDAATMQLHHDKHHATYVANVNAALEGTDYADWSIEQLLTQLHQLPESLRVAVRNNGGGHFNHCLFWQQMLPGGSTEPTGELGAAIDRDFGSFDTLKEQFTAAATKRFGSGWAWLYKDEGGALIVVSTPNQDSPMMDNPQHTSILGLDVWEHAYYLHYQNRRPEYIAAWWQTVNWDVVSRLYEV